MRLRLASALIFVLAITAFAYLAPDEYTPGQVLVTFSQELGTPEITDLDGIAQLGVPELDRLAERYVIYRIEKVFPHKQKPAEPEAVDFSRWYRFHFPQEIPVEEVVDAYRGKRFIEVIEHDPVFKNDFVPNDPMFASQWYLGKIVADSAWDICQGDKFITIGIVDSGTDTSHQDLWSQTWGNLGEDLNGDSILTLMDMDGQDNDGNGYIDDLWGWDFIGLDPFIHDDGGDGHGALVAGSASAATNNLQGIAGTAYNCRLMNLRTGQGGFNQVGYLGITYAADNDADVINCSWGAAAPSYYVSQAVEHAHNMGVVICASAGNEGAAGPYNYYPSKHNHVIAVGASDQQDRRVSFSNYCITPFDGNVDVMAPGIQILSTSLGGGYENTQGTSFAAPITAGVCALIISLNPYLTTAEVESTLVHGCDNIDAQNPSLQPGQLGHGRINAFQALLQLAHYLMVDDYTIVDDGNNDGRPDPGETCELRVTLLNDPRAMIAMNITAELSCRDNAVTVTQDSANFGVIMNGATGANTFQPFIFTVDQTEPHFANFTLIFTDYTGLETQASFQLELGRPEILLVDDDGGEHYQTFYQTSLDCLDVFADIWDQTESSITADELNRYGVVIWETGNDTITLAADERTALAGFMDGGGSLLFSSKNAGSAIGSESFYTNYLKANFVTGTVPTSAIKAYGVDGEPFTSGADTLFFIGGTGGGNYRDLDAIEPAGGSSEAYRYYSTTYTCGVYYEGAYKLIYLSFPLETVTGLAGTVPRETALEYMLGWLGFVGVAPGFTGDKVPADFALSSNYPNPFNPSTSIDFALPHRAEISLKVYNSAGQLVTELVEGIREAGIHTAYFDGAGLSSGLYFARLEAEGATLTSKMLLLK